MGVSTDAILCFGIRVESETIEQFEEPDDEAAFEELKKENPLGYMAFSGDDVQVDGVKIDLVHHQSASFPEYIVAAAESVVTAWRGSPKAITSIDSKPEWADAIAKFCKKNKVSTEGTVGWWLASDWGT